MSPPVRTLLLLCVLAGVVLAIPPSRLGGQAAPGAGAPPEITAQARAATFTFAPDTAGADRRLVTAAVARARPEARRLVAVVDGLTELHVGPAGPGALGTTSDTSDGYVVVVDVARTLRGSGPRGVDRVVLHELGHVVDRALVGDDAMGALLAGIPGGWGCDQGVTGACAPPEERFAETFAKWATADIGVDLAMGYKVPPPSLPLDEWAAPLTALGR